MLRLPILSVITLNVNAFKYIPFIMVNKYLYYDFRSRSFSYRHIAFSPIKSSFMVRRFIMTLENEDIWVYLVDNLFTSSENCFHPFLQFFLILRQNDCVINYLHGVGEATDDDVQLSTPLVGGGAEAHRRP